MRVELFFVVTVAAALLCAPSAALANAESSLGDRLLAAARQQNIDDVHALVKDGSDVNAAQPDGATALHWAAHWNDIAMADVLLRAGARVNQANAYGATPLWLASLNGSAAMVETLLDRGADPNVALRFGETPLFTATRGGVADVVRALLASGATVDAREAAQGQTPLMWAAAEGHVDVMRELIEAGANIEATSNGGFTPLMFVARQGSLEAARLLLDRGAAINTLSKASETALLTAVVRGHVDLAEFLLQRGAEPDLSGTGYTALHWAAGTWETSITTDYVFTDGEWSALRGLPSQDAKLRMIKALIAHGADVNARAKTEPLRTGYTLITSMPPALRQDTTPFYLAALAADTTVMRLLADLGADPSVPSANNTTPLMMAAGRVRIDYETRITAEQALAAVKLAVELGNPINAANDDGETALHAAAVGGLNSVVEYLVQQGASLTARNNAGRTPAEWADAGLRYATILVQRPETAVLLRELASK